MPMITVVSLNPCMDKTVTLPSFDLHSANRVTPVRMDVGGKGMNVCRMLRALDAPVRLVGLDFTGTPDVLPRALDACAIPRTLIPAQGALRVNLKILDQQRQCTIEINEESAPVDASTLQRVEDAILDSTRDSDFLILTGSLPKGAPRDFYRTLCEKAHALSCPVAVDCDGDALLEALKAAPDLIKPNEQELDKLVGHAVPVQEVLPTLQRIIRETGVHMICHSRGKGDAYLATQDRAVRCASVDVPVRGVYGAGDSMLAGVCHALCQGKDLREALRCGAAAAHATIQLPGTTMGDKHEYERLLPLFDLREV